MRGKFLLTFEGGTDIELVGEGADRWAALLDLVTAFNTGVLAKLTEFYGDPVGIEYTGEEEDEAC